MSDIIRLLIIILLLVVGLSAYFLVVNALFAVRVTKTRSISQSMPLRSLGIGFVNFVFLAVVAMVLLSIADKAGPVIKGILTVPAVIILAFLAVLLSFGLAGVAALVGERLFSDFPAWKQTLWGAVCMSFACALPFVGWFLLLPYVGFVGVGAVILSLFQRENKA
jgi:hypothetical protein